MNSGIIAVHFIKSKVCVTVLSGKLGQQAFALATSAKATRVAQVMTHFWREVQLFFHSVVHYRLSVETTEIDDDKVTNTTV